MKPILDHLWKIALIAIVGLSGSAVAGLIRYGSEILNPSGIAFAFVAYGLSGGFIFAFYHVRGLSNTITAAVCVGAVQFIIQSAWISMANAVVWSFGVNLSFVVVAFLFERKLAALKQAKFLVVGIIFGMVFVLVTLFVAIFTNVESIPAEVFRENYLDGLLMGLGLGIGVELGEAFILSVKEHRK